MLSALVEAFRSGLVNADAVSSGAPVDNVETALSVLEREFGVPRIVDTQDIVTRPDEKSMLMYLSEVRRAVRTDPTLLLDAKRGADFSARVAAGSPSAPPAASATAMVVSPRKPETRVSPRAGNNSNNGGERSVSPRPVTSPDGSVASSLAIAVKGTIPHALLETACTASFANEAAFSEQGGASAGLSWTGLAASVLQAQKAFLALGIKKGNRVAIVGEGSKTRVAYFGAICAGAVPVGIYAKELSAPLEIDYVFQCSQPVAIVVGSVSVWEKIFPRIASLSQLKSVVFDSATVDAKAKSGRWKALVWNEFIASSAQTAADVSNQTLSGLRPSDTAVVAFTSGLVSAPRLVSLTHESLLATARALQSRLRLRSPSDRILGHLPVANAQAQLFELLLPCVSGAHVVYCAQEEDDFVARCVSARANLVAAHPLQWHALQHAMELQHVGRPAEQLSTAEKQAIVAAVGLADCKFPFCVWSAVSSSVVSYFRSLGVPLARTYGLTEASGLVSLEDPSLTAASPREGLVGTPLSCVTVSLDDSTQEILLKGSSLFTEYAASDAPRASTSDGRFRTGDLGAWVGPQLVMSGRAGDVFHLQSGAVLLPQEPEAALQAHPFISSAMVCGNRQTYAVAFLTLDRSVMEPLAKARGVTVSQLAASPQVGVAIKALVDSVNAGRAKDVRIRKFAILPSFSSAKGEITPTLALRREEIMRNHQKAVDALFSPDVNADLDRLQKCAAGCAGGKPFPVTLFAGPGKPVEFATLSDMQSGVTYWTEDGNDVVRNRRKVVLAGQHNIVLPPDQALVDSDELALVNMLFANGAAVPLWKDAGASGEASLKAAKAQDFPVDEVMYTVNGTPVVRTAAGMLLVNKTRQVPLDLMGGGAAGGDAGGDFGEIGSEIGSEVGSVVDSPAAVSSPASMFLSAEELPPTPSSPGSRRLADIRKAKREQEAKRAANEAKKQQEREERMRLDQERAKLEREKQEEMEKLRVLEEEQRRIQAAAEVVAVKKVANPTTEMIDEDELALVNMLYAGGAAIPLWKSDSQFGEGEPDTMVSSGLVFPLDANLYTANGTSVMRKEAGLLVVGGNRVIPLDLEMVSAESGSEAASGSRSTPFLGMAPDEFPSMPSTPGSRRLTQIRKEKQQTKSVALPKKAIKVPDPMLVDGDELAIINLLYAGGAPVALWYDGGSCGEGEPDVRAFGGRDFPVEQTMYTANGTTVLAKDVGLILVDGNRQIPLEIEMISAESGSEQQQSSERQSMYLAAVEVLPPAPSTPGSRRLQEMKRQAESSKRKQKKPAPSALHVDADELAIVNMVHAAGPAVPVWRSEEAFGEGEADIVAASGDAFPAEEAVYTARGTSVLRNEEADLIVVDGKRYVPLQLDVSDARVAARQSSLLALSLSTPGSRRITELRRLKKEEKERQQREAVQRALQEEEERNRVAAEAEAAAAAANPSRESGDSVSGDGDSLPLVVLIGAETLVGGYALDQFVDMGAGDHFLVRPVLCGAPDLDLAPIRASIVRTSPELKDIREIPDALTATLDEFKYVMKRATRVLLIVGVQGTSADDCYDFAEKVFLAAKEHKVESLTLLSKVRAEGSASSVQFGRIEARMGEILESDCTIARAGILVEDLLATSGVTEDNRHAVVPLGDGRCAPISAKEVGEFCAELAVRDGIDGHVLTITGPSLVSGSDIAGAVGRGVSYSKIISMQALEARACTGWLPRMVYEDALAASKGAFEIISTEDFQDVVDRKPLSFSEWAAKNAEDVGAVLDRKFPVPQQQQQRSSRVPSAIRNGESKLDLMSIRDHSSALLGTPCRLCATHISVTRWAVQCCECGFQACRKCVIPFQSSLIKPKITTLPRGIPPMVCESCISGLASRLQEFGRSAGDMDAVRAVRGEVEQLTQIIKQGKCGVCTRSFENCRQARSCASCHQSVCTRCAGRVRSEVLEFPEDHDLLCEHCIPELKSDIRDGDVEPALRARELQQLDLVTLGVAMPRENVSFPVDLTPAEQDAVIAAADRKCHVCRADFGFLLRPHRCQVCCKLVCSKDSANHVSSDVLAIQDGWLCRSCLPHVQQELSVKSETVEVLQELASAERRDISALFSRGSVSGSSSKEVDSALAFAKQADKGKEEQQVAPVAPPQPQPIVVDVSPRPVQKQLSTTRVQTQSPVATVATTAAAAGASDPARDARRVQLESTMVDTCPHCDRELSQLVCEVECVFCREARCTSCCYHFRSSILGWGVKGGPPHTNWVCSQCTKTLRSRIRTTAQDKPKLTALSEAEINRVSLVMNKGAFLPLEEPEFFEFNAKELKALEAGKSKCYSCASKYSLVCNPRRCGKCRKVVCTRCTVAFTGLGRIMDKSIGDVCVCYDCWPGVKLSLEFKMTENMSIRKALQAFVEQGDAALAAGPAKHPLDEQKDKLKEVSRKKCLDCQRKFGLMRGVAQCRHCERFLCSTCTSLFYVPEYSKQALTRLCCGCSTTLLGLNRIGELSDCSQGVVLSRESRPGDGGVGAVAQAARALQDGGASAAGAAGAGSCKNCSKDFDFWRRAHTCLKCGVASCWQCTTVSFVPAALGNNGAAAAKKARVCRSCIPLCLQDLDGAAAPPEVVAAEKAFLTEQAHRLEVLDRSDTKVVEEASSEEDVRSPTAPGADVSGSSNSALEKRPSFLRRTFSRKLKDPAAGTAGCHVCGKAFGLTRKEKLCAECSHSVCTSCSSDQQCVSLKWTSARRVCDRCLVPLRGRVSALLDSPYDYKNAAADLKAIDARLPAGTGVQKKPGATGDEDLVQQEVLKTQDRRRNSTLTAERAIPEDLPAKPDVKSPSEPPAAVGVQPGTRDVSPRPPDHAHDIPSATLSGKCPSCRSDFGFYHPATNCSKCGSAVICSSCDASNACPKCGEAGSDASKVSISLPRPAPSSPSAVDRIPDLEGTEIASGAFSWNDVGMPQGLPKKQELEFKVKHIEDSLRRLAALEAEISNKK